MKDAVFHSYSWKYDGTEQRYGINISSFKKDPAEYEAAIIFRGTEDQRRESLDNFLETAEFDIINKTPGNLIIGDYYITAYVISSNTTPYEGSGWTQKNVIFLCPYPFWIHEEKRSFPVISDNSESDSFLDYEHDYNYDYTMPYGGDVIWQVDHYAPCEYEMIIYGPCVDPRVTINGHIYQVYATLDENDYLKINSRENSVVQYLANGTQRDLYDYRVKITGSLFDPITPGNVRVVWSGEFGFDLTLFCERSEPRWKIQGS